MNRDWTRAVYPITGPDGDSRGQGTGFACAREGGDLLLITCWHVVREIGPEQLRVQGKTCELVSAPGDDQLDLAVLRAPGMASKDFLRLAARGETGLNFETYGYGPTGRPLSGSLGASLRHLHTSHEDVAAWDYYLSEHSRELETIEPGYSGAPVWDPRARRVLAVITHRSGSDKGFAIDIANLPRVYPQAKRWLNSKRPEAEGKHRAASTDREYPAMASGSDSGPIRILHLSDFHFSGKRAWDADPVMGQLAATIGREVSAGLAPDLVAITGDLAFSGKTAEYKQARQWLEQQLWPRLSGLPKDRLLLVPGNHDVDRSAVKRSARSLHGDLLKEADQQSIAEVLADPDERSPLLRRHDQYLAFHNTWHGAEAELPWWHRDLEIRGQTLHLLGLDSAWLACGDEDYGKLLLSRYQLNALLFPQPATGDPALRIALLHHPWAYLAEFEQQDARSLVHRHCDLVLRGHLHQAQSERILPPDPSRACLELAAGCVYESSRYPNAYQWIELWPADHRVKVHFRTWRDNEWMPDRNVPGSEDGCADFALSPQLNQQSIAASSPKPPVPSAYLDWLHRRYASVELLGYDQQEGRAVTLEHVYVPALTVPERERVTADTDEVRTTVERDQDATPALLLERLGKQSLYLPGPPGSGKSTFCRWAVLQTGPAAAYRHPVPAPEGYRETPPEALREHLPVLIPLREFWRLMDCGHGLREWSRRAVEQALACWMDRQQSDGLDGAGLLEHLGAGNALLLLDGLDEVPVSEPRDGHTDYPRALLLSGLQAALPAWQQTGNRILLTSRPYGLDETGLVRLGLTRSPLEPLPGPLQQLFVQRWFHALSRAPLGEELTAQIGTRPELEPLRGNPMLLTALCVIYGNGKRLPEDRYHLYQRIMDNVLYTRYPGDARQRGPVLARLQAIAYGMHSGELAGTPRGTPVAEIGWSEVERNLQVFGAHNPALEPGLVQPAVQREELLTRSGLLLPRPGERAAFYHLSFQEFLAAEYLFRTLWDPQTLEQVFVERGAVAEWQSTLLFLFAALAERNAQQGLELVQRLARRLTRDGVKANPSSAVLVAEILGLALAKKYRLPDDLKDGFRTLCLDAIADEVPVRDRLTLGLCLGDLGDPRVLDLRDPGAYVQVPAGIYSYGGGDETTSIERPLLLSRYPVTNSQYRAFIEAGGYDNPEWWSETGWAWRKETAVQEPSLWNNRHWSAPNLPVVGVSFWEAEACCAWAGGQLPSEQEWEAAARGPEGCEYPWCGDWEDGICNSEESGLNRTSPVGLFPRSRQAALGLEDLAGNVWEWCDSFYKQGADDAAGPRVLRGGAFNYESRGLRASIRIRFGPEIRGRFVGFRCVLAPRRQP